MRQASIVLLLTLTCYGCSNEYYAPVLYKNDITYQFKPTSTDSAKTANYLTGSLIKRYSNGNDRITVGQLAYNRANTYQSINLSYGAYGFYGNYENRDLKQNDPGYFSNKSLSGLGLRFSANCFAKEDNLDNRFIGIDASYSTEFGDYSNYRKSVQNTPYIYSDANNSVLTLGITNEIVWHKHNSTWFQYGYRFFAGAVFGNHQFINGTEPQNDKVPFIFYKDECLSGTFFMQIKKYQGIFEISNLSTARISFGYKF